MYPSTARRSFLLRSIKLKAFYAKTRRHLSQSVSIYRITNDGVTASTQGSFEGNALAEEIASRREPYVISKMPMISESLVKL